jgi:hypothetical protein
VDQGIPSFLFEAAPPPMDSTAFAGLALVSEAMLAAGLDEVARERASCHEGLERFGGPVLDPLRDGRLPWQGSVPVTTGACMGWRRGWLAGPLAALAVIAAAAAATAAEEYSCANPIAPSTACHSPELARDLAEPWIAPATVKELTSPVAASERGLRFAKASDETYCDGCRGPAGDGKGTIALKFSVPAINIGAPSVQAQTDGELFWKISNGKGAMPAWKSLLSDEDRWRLVAFVRTFRSR